MSKKIFNTFVKLCVVMSFGLFAITLIYVQPISLPIKNHIVNYQNIFTKKTHEYFFSIIPNLTQTHNNISFQVRKCSRKMFLYVIQVAECIRNDVLTGMGNNESHDILALSYKSVCSLNTFEHVRYITAGYKTTWTSGRNFLYR